ncbi:MAG TPA: flagellar biosynthesis protein FlhB [Ignavibacteriales bacterium]|nr:flagellar biosynthesis protein FlhB [Ignavibacteriales bacterium]
MAEVDGQEKTEQATGKRLSDSREKGQVAKSIEINSFAIFTTGLLLVFMLHKHLGESLSAISVSIFSGLDKLTLNKDNIADYALKGFGFFFTSVGPIFGGLFLMAIIVSYGQVGFRFSPQALAPKFSKFNPFTNVKNLFFSSRSLMEVGKSLIKLTIIALFTYWVLKDFILTAIGLVNYQMDDLVEFMLEAAYTLLWKISLCYALIAAADFAFQKYKFRQDMMMTKQEVKEEMRQSEGNPEIKSKIKSIQIKQARARMMKELPKADVVITNPTHFAVALKYDLGKDSAPKVIAKGMDELAQRIKKVAVEKGVPLHEDVQLARALYKNCEIGDEIPAELFKAVAQILAYIFRVKNEKKKKSIV